MDKERIDLDALIRRYKFEPAVGVDTLGQIVDLFRAVESQWGSPLADLHAGVKAVMNPWRGHWKAALTLGPRELPVHTGDRTPCKFAAWSTKVAVPRAVHIEARLELRIRGDGSLAVAPAGPTLFSVVNPERSLTTVFTGNLVRIAAAEILRRHRQSIPTFMRMADPPSLDQFLDGLGNWAMDPLRPSTSPEGPPP